MKKCLLSVATSIVLLFLMNFFFHQICLKETYMATAHLWRPEASMKDFVPFMLLGQILVGAFYACIFAKGYRGTGLKEGLRFGLLLGGLQAGFNFVMYAISPYELSMVSAWIAIDLVECVVIGLALAKIWGSEVPCSTAGCMTKGA